jgi:hypothetical protein
MAIAQKRPDNNSSDKGKGKPKSMYCYWLFVCTIQLELTCIQERRTDRLYGMAASMSADLIRSMPKHPSEASQPAHIESQGKKFIYSHDLKQGLIYI